MKFTMLIKGVVATMLITTAGKSAVGSITTHRGGATRVA